MAAEAGVDESPAINRILTGHFKEKAGYHVHRPAGTHDWLLIYTTAGSGEFGFTDHSGGHGRLVTTRGDVVLLPPGTPHDYGVRPSGPKWDLLWAHFHPRAEWHPWLDWSVDPSASAGLMRLSICDAAERMTVERALRKMNDLAVGPHRLSETLAMNALEEAVLWCAKSVLRPADHDPRIEQAEVYLCQHLRDNVTLNDLADAVGLSVSRLSSLFKRQTGLTPQQYYETQRLERARQLLELTNLPVKSVAAETGFDNPFYFTLRFKRYAGVSPRAYRLERDQRVRRHTVDGPIRISGV